LTDAWCADFLSDNNLYAQGTLARPGLSAPQTRNGPREETVTELSRRIEAMHRRDVQVAWAFVAGLWVAILFVAWATWSLAPSSGARIVLLCAGGVILLLNTAAITAMLRHYREDRDFMYGLDIKFLDAARAAKGK
jgi:hypothetical protein